MTKMQHIWKLLGFVNLLLPAIEALICDDCSALEFEASVFLKRENELLRRRKHAENLAAYTYNTNITEPNRQAMVAIAAANVEAAKRTALKLRSRPYYLIPNETIARQVRLLSRLDFNVLPANDFKDLFDAITAMQMNYATAKVCPWNSTVGVCDLTLVPTVTERLRNSRNPDELAHYWTQWYNAAGTPSRADFKTYVTLSRKAARLNGFPSYAEELLSNYEDPYLERTVDALYQKLAPFYQQLHGYVRFRLRQFYGPDVVPAFGNIPMHLLGNIWGQQWDGVIDLLTPFPNVPFVNVTPALLSQGITVPRMAELGDEFFRSMNMRALPASFFDLSVLVRPTDRPVVCDASSWDLYQDSDVRVKVCAQVNSNYFRVLHHELGHVQYYLQYEKQPTVFRNAPNPSFPEAIGDVIALSASTPKHLNRLGLLPSPTLSNESRINELFKAALQNVVLIPFAYALEKWRYGVFRDEIDENVWNCNFWQLRSEFTGVEPPVIRTDLDFDPTAKFHVAADVEYLRFLGARVFMLQFLKALCIAAGQYDPNDPTKPLDNCDIFGSTDAGRLLSDFLSLGASKHWQEALCRLTGENTIDPTAVLEYFKPLYEWLLTENRRLGVPIGWGATDKVAPDCCPAFST